MFSSLIVASAGPGPDSATRVAAQLAARSALPVETFTVGADVDVAAAIVERVRSRDGALLLMTTGAATLVTDVRRSVTARVLAELSPPGLVLGPHIVEPIGIDEPTLVVAVDNERGPQPTVDVVRSWCQTFGGPHPRMVDLIATSGWPEGSSDAAIAARTEAMVASFAGHGVDADGTVLRAGDAVAALLQVGEEVRDAVFVLTSERWPGGRSHWHATTRRLLQRARHPVLVVPADLTPLP